MIDRNQVFHVLDRDFRVEDVRVLGEPRHATMVVYEAGHLKMVPDISVEVRVGQEFVQVPEDLLVFNPAGSVADPGPNQFFLSTGNQEGLYYLLCCDVFPERDDFPVNF